MATTSETFATESFDSPVERRDRKTLPSASDHFRLLVSGTQMVVAMALRLSASV